MEDMGTRESSDLTYKNFEVFITDCTSAPILPRIRFQLKESRYEILINDL